MSPKKNRISPRTNTIASIGANDLGPLGGRLQQARERAEEIKVQRLQMQEGSLPDPRSEHLVRCRDGEAVHFRRYGPGEYFCSRCLDLEKIYYRQGADIASRDCSCLEQRRQAGRQEEWDRRLAAARLRKKYRQRNFDNFEVTENNRVAYEAAREYARSFAVCAQSGRSLVLVGGVGRGKTHLAAAVLQEVLRQGYQGIFIVAVELLNEIRDSYARDSRAEGRLMSMVKETDLLVLDDLAAAERFTEWERGKIYELINARYEEEKPMVITTHRTISWVEERLGKKVVDRLLEMSGELTLLDGENYRERIAESLRRGQPWQQPD